MSNEPLDIAIIGAGPSGLMLARLLTVQSPSPNLKITIFESDPTPVSRSSNGGTLDLHPSTGLLAMKQAGLYEKFLEKARFDGTSLLVCDKKGKAWLKIPPTKEGSNGNPEIDRVELRGLLLGSLEGEKKVDICWGMKTKIIERTKNGLEVVFVSGERRGGFDLVIGADGGWSKTRTSYLDTVTKPEYSSVMGFNFSIPDAEAKSNEEWQYVNKGSVFAFGDAKHLVAQQLGNGSLHINAWITTGKDGDQQGVVKKSRATILEDYFADWSEELRAFVAKSEPDSSESRFLFSLPEKYRWDHKEGVTLLGDSAHLMLPFAGEGVNLAFEDAMKLCSAISDGAVADLDQRIQRFEEDMFSRAQRAQKMTRGMAKALLFNPDAPRNGIESWILCKFEYELPMLAKWGWPLMLFGVYGWFSIVKLFY